MITASKLAMRYGGQTLFENSTFTCRPGERYGVVGKNGAGKSTLLQMIAGEFPPADGELDFSSQAEIGLLKQDHYVYESWRLLDVVIAGKPRLQAAIEEKHELLNHEEFTEEDGIRLGELEGTIAENNGYEAESFAHRLLSGLGIDQSKHTGPLSALSGGFKLRVLLAQVLFQNPDILLLDEPTNHLDITSIHWLEEYLKESFQGILLFVSHDRHFLNSVSSHILDIDYGTVTDYTGNYERFLFNKVQAEERAKQSREQQEAKVDQLKEFVNKFGAKASKAAQARSKQKQIDRIELTEIKTSNRGSPYFNFKMTRPSGKQVIETKSIAKAYGSLQVLTNISFQAYRGEKIAIIGPNGMGKSTLLKIIMDQIKPDEGTYEWGYETQTGYFAQDHHEQLLGELTVHQWLDDKAPAGQRENVRSYLGQMLFSGDSVNKKISQLSGGEAGRLLIAGLMINQPNVLILDEPTNHLDLEAITGLMEALRKYEGTVLFVSHDRDFVRALASRIIVLTPQGLRDITASYDDYLNAAGEDFLDREAKAAAAPKESNNKKSKKKEKRTSTKTSAQLQHEIATLEGELLAIDGQMANPAFYESGDTDAINEMTRDRERLQSQIDRLMAQWENLENTNPNQ